MRGRVFGFGLDVVCVVVFVVIGRRTHEGVGSVVDVLGTFWPFFVGVCVGWVSVGWRRPLVVWPSGVAVWVSAVVVGMVLRGVSGQGTAGAFVVVACLFLGATLLGWRGVARVVR
ncbi:DUF3054 domain-containing protein [Actinomadura atramentaria]|uniref:DUF3054 domain-containing protein n=1 Tax=Actinomadura atramentaria TaxID=1990 RepID=UPI000A0632E9|nr:DUF3054 domain-containing protein [Actinomadura atramentaria]